MELNLAAASRWLDRLGGAKDNQTDFGRDAQAYWSADSPEAAIHVDMSHRGRGRGEERGAENPGDDGVRSGAFLESRGEERALVESGNIVGDEARGAEAMVEDLDLDLSAVGVAGKGKFDAEFCGAVESVGIARKQNVGNRNLLFDLANGTIVRSSRLLATL